MITFSKDKLLRHLERRPMLKALVPLVVGILLADGYALPVWGVAIGFVVCAVGAYLFRSSRAVSLYVVGMVLTAGMMATTLRSLSERIEPYELLEVVIDDITARRGDRIMGTAHVVAHQSAQGARRTTAPIRFVADSVVGLAAGDRVVSTAQLGAFDSEQSYGRYMTRRGFVGQLALHPYNITLHQHSSPTLSHRLRSVAEQRIERLRLSDDVERVAKAVAIGQRSEITPAIREDYTAAGAAHLLAVSGLHVGFVCAVIMLLLGWLPLIRWGHVVRCVVVIVAIWLYAAVAGFTPSIIRAAVMFSVMQAAIQLSSHSTSANTLCFTAVVMLCWDARMIYDAGFLLSFLSVAAIIEWAVPLAVRSPRPQNGRVRQAAWWAMEWLRSAFVVSLVASVATAPMVAYLFGRFSLWGVVAGPLLVALTAAAVGSVIVWVLLPIGVLQGVASGVIETLIGAMNSTAAWCAEAERMNIEWQAEGWACAGAYILFAIITLTAWAIEKKY